MRVIVLLGVLLTPTASSAQQSLPPPVQAGLDSLARGRCEVAFRIWTATWAKTQDGAAKREAIVGSCKTLNGLGSVSGYDIIQVVPVTKNLLRVYVLLKYEMQPVYLLLVAYRPDATWGVTSVNWNTNSENVLPPNLLPPENLKP
jgi:hypothetical protein